MGIVNNLSLKKTGKKISRNRSLIQSYSKYSQRNKIRINLTKQVKDLYNENFKHLRKNVEKDTQKWKDNPCPWFAKSDIVKTTILQKSIYTFNAIHKIIKK